METQKKEKQIVASTPIFSDDNSILIYEGQGQTEAIKLALVELYQRVKIRDRNGLNLATEDEKFLINEKGDLRDINELTLIDYIS